ncbi:MAG: formimidoylglutamate deiminase [Geminicoccaceae bacterium]
MPSLYAETALLPSGWARDVRIDIDPGGRIAAVETDTAARAGDERLIGRALLPAPSNLHSHTFQRAMAGLTEWRGAGEDSFWTWRTRMYEFLARLTPEDIETVAAMAFVEMLEAGFASVAEFHYVHHQPGGTPYADPAETAARIVAAAATTGIGLTLLPVLYVQAGADGRPAERHQSRFVSDLDLFQRMVDGSRTHLRALPHARLGVAPHSLRATSPALIDAAARMAPDGPIHIHAAEQTREVEEVEAAFGARPVDLLLDRIGLDERWCLIHATHMSREETLGLARSGAVAGLCPVTESNLGDGIFPGRAFLDAGGRFGVGTDSNVLIGYADEIRTLEYSQRLAHQRRNVLGDPAISTGRALFQASLAGGSQALGRASGAIAEGRLADLVALDLDHPSLAGRTGDAVLDSWIFASHPGAVRDVWSAGVRNVTDGRHRHRESVATSYNRLVRSLLN